MYSKTIVCLANSRKPPSGRCVAGREFDAGAFGAWIRPVSERPSREISEEERRYKDGQDPQVLDIVTVTMAGSVPHDHQQENHQIDSRWYWAKQGTVSWSLLQSAVEDPNGPLWINDSSSFNGQNDRVHENQVARLRRSLFLVRPEELTISVALESATPSQRRKVRAQFSLCGYRYCLVVTDPWLERQYLAQPDGAHALPDAVICVSLGEVFHGFAYKLAAAVITRKRADG